MTVTESTDRLRARYIKWYVNEHNHPDDGDAKYSWWERERECQEWSSKEGTYVLMSETKTLRVMREWFKSCRQK